MIDLCQQASGFSETLANAVELARLLYAVPTIQDRGGVEIDAIHSDRKFYLWIRYYHFAALVWVQYDPERGFDVGEVIDDMALDCGEFSILPDPTEGQLTVATLGGIAEVVENGINRWLNREMGDKQ